MNEYLTPDTHNAILNDETFRPFSPEDMREENKEIVAEYVAELHKLEPVVKNLVAQLAEGMTESRWDAIVGDDIRGRIIALMVGQVARQYAETSGQITPNRLFIATGRHEMEERWPLIDSYIEHVSDQLGDRVLFTTEYIESGETVYRTIEAFQRAGITCDIASAYIMTEDTEHGHQVKVYLEELRKKVPKWRGSLYVGEETYDVPTINRHIFKLYNFMGIEKALNPTTVSSARLETANAEAEGMDEQEIAQLKKDIRLEQATIIKPIREEVKSISDRIYSYVFETF